MSTTDTEVQNLIVNKLPYASWKAAKSAGTLSATEAYEITNIDTILEAETTARQNADNDLQGQIDAITAASDVTDIVGTKAELNAYDTSTLPPNSIIKVLQDESQNNETTYYRWVITSGTGAWTLIGEEGPYYTKSETDVLLQAKQDTITGAASTITSSNLTSNKALISGSNGKVATSSVTDTELGYVSGVTSNIQTQLNAKAADNAVVKLTGDQTIYNTKTFSTATGLQAKTPVILKQDSSLEGGEIRFQGADNEPNASKTLYIDRYNGKLRMIGHDSNDTTYVGLELDFENATTKTLTPTEDTTSSTQIDTVGARNTKLQGYADNSLSNLSSDGQMVIDSQNSTISNCILEIPQDIKLEFSGRTVTLKNGSSYYTPNDVGVFDKTTTTADITATDGLGYIYNPLLICVDNGGNLRFRPFANCVSGAGATATSGFAYDLTTNKIGYYDNTGALVLDKCSLPLAKAYLDSSNNIISLEVFNGVGYIGSSAYILPNVKALVAKGKNEDGSLKSILTKTTSVLVTTDMSGATGGLEYWLSCTNAGNPLDISRANYGTYTYNEEQNIVVDNSNVQQNRIMIDGNAQRTNGKVSSLVIRQPVRLATTEMLNTFTGADGTNAGTSGLVPAPAATDNNKFLRGDGTWVASTTSTAWGNITGTLSNQTDLNEALESKLDTTQISNCITEIPQDIKLELSNNILTVKAGTKVYSCDGNFTAGTISTDKSNMQILGNGYTEDGEALVWILNGDRPQCLPKERVISGSTNPTGLSGMYLNFNISDNWTYFTSNGGANWQQVAESLPICIITTKADGTPKTIKQVFNGFGYIGSTVFALPGVKGLIPNGRNADGTLRSSEFTRVNVATTTLGGSIYEREFATNGGANTIVYNKQFYDKETNYIHANSEKSGIIYNATTFAYISSDSTGKITSLTPKTAFHAVDYNDYQALSNEVDTNTSNIALKQDKATAVNYDNITNCITEIPQNIKLELNNGTLTLKAGSKVYVPNGSGVFDTYTFTEDKTVTYTALNNAVGFVYITESNNIEILYAGFVYSGDSAPSGATFMLWYDTANNLVKKTTNGGNNWTSGCSLPIALVYGTTSGLTAINQVFNGFGYIGKINFITNVKFLVAKGYNTDGTHHNQEYVINSPIIARNNFGNNSIMFIRNNSGFQIYNIAKHLYLGELDYVPAVGSTFQWYYNTTNRMWYMHEQSEQSWRQVDYANIGINTSTETNFKEVFRAVDYNDFADLKDEVATKQDTLVSGTNIKTINGDSVLGSGDLTVGGSSRNIGERVESKLPVTDAGLHELDGGVIQRGSYADFVDYIADLYNDNPNADYFCQQREKPWVQPIATASTTAIEGGDMVITTSSEYSTYNAWKAMDGIKSGTTATTGWGTNNTSATQWWQLKLPYQIRITGIKVYHRYDGTASNSNTIGRFYTSSAMTTPIGNELNDMSSVNWSETIITGIPVAGIATDTLYFQKTGGGNYGGLGEVEITATVVNDYMTPEEVWQESVDIYGSCDKFVYDSTANTVRLPKRTSEHGNLIKSYKNGTDWYRIYEDGWCEQGSYKPTSGSELTTVDLLKSYIDSNYDIYFGEARTLANSHSGSDNSQIKLGLITTSNFGMYINTTSGNGVFWQACGYVDISNCQYNPIYEYIVIATTTKTDIQVDIDEIATDLNAKVDKSDLSEVHCVIETYSNGTDWYRVYDDGWVEQGGRYLRTATGILPISLLKPYISTNYSILTNSKAMDNYVSAGSFNTEYVLNQTTIGFSVSSPSAIANIGYFTWEARGYGE